MDSPWLIAVFDPLNTFMLGASVVAGLIAAWWLFPLGLLFWLVMVARIALDPGLRLSQRVQSRGSISQRFQDSYRKLQTIQVRLHNVISVAPLNLQSALQPVRSAMDALMETVYQLILRVTPLENYRLTADSPVSLTEEMKSIQHQLDSTQDAHLKDEYQEALEAVQARIDRYQSVALELNTVDAQLASLMNDVDNILTTVLKLQAATPATKIDQDQIQTLVLTLGQKTQEINSFQITFNGK